VFENIFKFFNNKKEESSKDFAKERLKLVLIHDKANVSPQFLEMVKGEIIKVIKQYMEIDESCLDIQLTKTKSDESGRIVPMLVTNIPILNVKTTETKKEAPAKKVEPEVEEVVESTETVEEKKPKATAKKTVKK
jgi:cell division topological specificity factor